MVKGWVSVHIIGNEALKSVLNKLPEGEFVFWSSGMGVTNTYQSQINLALPDELIIDDIRDYSKGCGLDLNIYSGSE